MKKTAIILVLCFIVLDLRSQDSIPNIPVFPRYNIGFGAGIDYGGFGGRFTVLTSQRLEFFGAIGYNLLGLGLNAGVDYRLMPMSRICPYFGVMYGYNASIKIIGAEMYNQTYYGPSFNLGLELWNIRNTNFFSIELIVPIRSSDYHEDLKSLKNNPAITLKNEPLPIGISLGYHFAF